jgi:hypothetical protein
MLCYMGNPREDKADQYSWSVKERAIMDQASINSVAKIVKMAQEIENFRRSLNQEYSEAQDNEAFETAVDFLFDYLVQIVAILDQLVAGKIQAPQAEDNADKVTKNAQKVSIGAIRSLADERKKTAGIITSTLDELQIQWPELAKLKQELDKSFQDATRLHENNDAAALEALCKSIRGYSDFVSQAQAQIAGTRRAAKRELRWYRLVWIATITGATALVVTIIGRENILNFVISVWKMLWKQ